MRLLELLRMIAAPVKIRRIASNEPIYEGYPLDINIMSILMDADAFNDNVLMVLHNYNNIEIVLEEKRG